MSERWPFIVRKGAALASLAGSALLGLSACRDGERPRAEDSANPAGSARAVELTPVAEGPLEQRLEIAGTLNPDDRVIVGAKVAGRLASLDVDIASRVEAGQLIAQLETREYQLEVAQARAALAQARAELGLEPDQDVAALDVENTAIVRQASATRDEAAANLARARALSKEGLTTGSELEAAEATAVRAETALQAALETVRIRRAAVTQRLAALRAAEQRLADTAVRAPQEGIVQARLSSTGAYLSVGAPIVEIVRIDPVRLRLAVPERDAPRVRTGQAVRVRVEGDPNTYSGSVTRIAPALDAASRTLLVEADIPNPGTLHPGNFVRAELAVGSRAALTIPKRALRVFAGISKVVLVEQGRAVERNVTLGETVGERVEVLAGLRAGEQVVLEPGSLQQGQPVRVKPGR